MLERLDETAVRAVMFATEQSRRLGHNFVGTEQLLLGIVGVPGIASGTLAAFGIYVKNLREEVIRIIGKGTGYVSPEVPFTPRANRMFELASQEAESLGSEDIKSEHLLLGLILEGEGVAVRALENLAVDLAELKTVLLEVIHGMPVPEPAEPAVPEIEFDDEQYTRAVSLEEATSNLYASYNFIKRDSVSEGMLDWIDQKESVVGVYINAEDNYLVVCNEGIHCYDGESRTYLGFDTLASVELPIDDDDRYLKLVVRPKNTVVMLPVWHDTEDVPDLYNMYDFIHFTLESPVAKIDIRNISSKRDLIAYLRQPSVTTDGLSDLATWLEEGSPKSSWLDTLKIEPTVWQDSNALRLMALVFTRFPNTAARN